MPTRAVMRPGRRSVRPGLPACAGSTSPAAARVCSSASSTYIALTAARSHDGAVGIVGAGPVGVVAAIACAGKGMQVALFEAEHEIDRSPRAATTHPSTLEMLAELGSSKSFSRRPSSRSISSSGTA